MVNKSEKAGFIFLLFFTPSIFPSNDAMKAYNKKQKRMVKMSRRGENIYKRKDGRWEGRYKPDAFSGKYKYVYAHTYKEVKEKLTDLKTNPPSKSNKKILTSNLCEQWLEFKKQDIKESTYIKYRNIISKHLKPILGNPYINSLKNEDTQKYVLLLKNKGLSNKSVRDILSVMSAIFKYAQKIGVYTNNINLEELYPKAEKRQIRILPDDERIRLEGYLLKSNDPAKLGILLALYSGMRIGEICALKWSNIDLKNETISVAQTLQRLQDRDNKGKTKILISEPKSQSSKRIIPIPAFLTELLRKIKPQTPDAFLLTGNQSLIEPKTMENKYKRCLKECDIPYINFHTLRHTFATRCVEVGFDIKSLSEILGHSCVGTTLNLYAHPTLEYKRNNMNKLAILK